MTIVAPASEAKYSVLGRRPSQEASKRGSRSLVSRRVKPEENRPGASEALWLTSPVVVEAIFVRPKVSMAKRAVSRSFVRSAMRLLKFPRAMRAAASFTARADAPVALAVALSRTQGNLASEINYRTMASIARDALPKIRNAVEFVVIALFPVLALLFLASGAAAGVLLRGYVSLLLTVQLWLAVASVVNHLMIAVDTGPFGALAREFVGNTLASLALIRETGATSQAIAGALMCMIPVITYALVRAGDVAVSSLVSGLMAPAQSAAAS